jgi:Fuc2NAc and GlcNAc transferase
VSMPRGGGLAIAVSFLAGLLALSALGHADPAVVMALTGSGALVALVGFLDDRRSRPPGVRLAVHLAAAVWALAWLGGMPPLVVSGATFNLGWGGHVLAVVGLVWMLNLFNFMDGIDGLATVEAVSVCLAGASFHLLRQPQLDDWLAPALLATAAMGFLWWNWSPARIFMGDAGSGFLGIMIGVLAIRATQVEPVLFWAWLILPAVFVTDATVTLFRRLRDPRRIHEPHRCHAYQHAAVRRGHRAVTLAVAAINTLWLVPIAFAVVAGWLGEVAGLALAYTPLVWTALRLGAGVSDIISATSHNA